MSLISSSRSIVSNTWKRIRMASLLTKIIFILLIGGVGWYGYTKLKTPTTDTPVLVTEEVKRGNLTISVSASGKVASTNASTITTQASGVVSKILVKEGAQVTAGQAIAQVDLDLIGRQKSAQAYASYQSAKNSLASAQASQHSLQSQLFKANQTFINGAVADNLSSSDPNFIQQNADWLASEASYKNQATVIAQAQTSLSSAWLSYQQSSATIYAPLSGKITGLSIQPGTILNSSNSTESTATEIGYVTTQANPTIQISLTEIDVPKVKIGNTVEVTIDALPNQTFPGKVVSIDTVGSSTSDVSSYPITIQLDTADSQIFSNMTANATITTDSKGNVLIVPSSAVQNRNDTSFVRVMKDGKTEMAKVETGLSSDTETEIISGLSEGDIIITSSPTVITGSSTDSPFGMTSFGGRSGGTGGGAVRIAR